MNPASVFYASICESVFLIVMSHCVVNIFFTYYEVGQMKSPIEKEFGFFCSVLYSIVKCEIAEKIIARQSSSLAFSVSGAWTLNIKHSRFYCNCLLLSDKDHRPKYRSTGLSLNAWMHRDEHGELGVFLWASVWCKNPVSCVMCMFESETGSVHTHTLWN